MIQPANAKPHTKVCISATWYPNDPIPVYRWARVEVPDDRHD
jgi:hypothetical protein